ncbi:MAG: hypothetical protein ACLFSK_06895, partial [Ectothiorhodospira sp.]
MTTGETDLTCSAHRSQLLVVDIQERLASAMSEADRARVGRCAGGLARAAGCDSAQEAALL